MRNPGLPASVPDSARTIYYSPVRTLSAMQPTFFFWKSMTTTSSLETTTLRTGVQYDNNHLNYRDLPPHQWRPIHTSVARPVAVADRFAGLLGVGWLAGSIIFLDEASGGGSFSNAGNHLIGRPGTAVRFSSY